MAGVPLSHFCISVNQSQKPAEAPFLAVLTGGGKCAIYTAVYFYSCVGVVARCQRPKEGNPGGLPSLSHYCKTVKLSFFAEIIQTVV